MSRYDVTVSITFEYSLAVEAETIQDAQGAAMQAISEEKAKPREMHQDFLVEAGVQ